ncbi:MAG: hypothetical protein II949_03660, partial [Prevotella sp.]|nr:hypothetical protein [Prevotella sp.]
KSQGSQYNGCLDNKSSYRNFQLITCILLPCRIQIQDVLVDRSDTTGFYGELGRAFDYFLRAAGELMAMGYRIETPKLLKTKQGQEFIYTEI